MAGLTHPGRRSQALLPSAVEVRTENNKVVALWDVMCQPCMIHATGTHLTVSYFADGIRSQERHAFEAHCVPTLTGWKCPSRQAQVCQRQEGIASPTIVLF